MSDSDSSLSPPPEKEDEEMEVKMSKPTGLNRYFKPAPRKDASPETPRRAPSPPHEYILADNDAIAFLVMFRSRFSDAFPKSCPHYGPQDIERGVAGDLPDEQVERLLCALLGLVLNRKKDVERGHHGRALEDAISSNQNQWSTAWKANPLHGGKTFNNMTPEERLILLKTLALWSLNSSESIQAMLKESYKQTRRGDDKNQPRSVQPWFSDSYRRRYWLVEGQEDSFFRVFRENDGKTAKSNTWFSVAGSIEEVNALADKFTEEGTTNAKVNAEKLRSAIPRFEAGDEKRRRRDYRLARKAAFTRPELGYSLYEGRTRGKRMKYTYSDGEEESDSYSTRRSTRHGTPLDTTGPTITASGRQVKPRMQGAYGESMLPDQRREMELSLVDSGMEADDSEDMPTTLGRPTRGATGRIQRPAARSHEAFNREDMESDDDGSEAQSSGKEWSGDENEPDGEEGESEGDFDDEDASGDDLDDDEPDTVESLVVKLSYRKPKESQSVNGLPLLAPTPQMVGGKTNGVAPLGLSLDGVDGSDTIEVAPASSTGMSDGAQDSEEQLAAFGNGEQKQSPTMNGNGHESAEVGVQMQMPVHSGIQGGHATKAQPPVQVQAMDVSWAAMDGEYD